MAIFILVPFQAYLEGLQEASGEEPSQTNIFPEDFDYALRYAKDKVIKVIVTVVEVEIAEGAIVVKVEENNIILTLIVHNWTFYPGRFPAFL